MNFTEWLFAAEGRNYPVAGAFGNDKRRAAYQRKPEPAAPEVEVPPPGPPQQAGRMNNRFQGSAQRVQYGKSIEKQIFDSLVQAGLKLREPSRQEDMYDKIDAWWTTGGSEKPIQIKYRDTGDDILFEVMKDYQKGVPGRDMVGKAVYYAVLTRAGTIVMVSVGEAKSLINTAVEAARVKGFDRGGNFRSGDMTLRIRPDPRSGQDKLMAYLPVGSLTQVIQPSKAQVTF